MGALLDRLREVQARPYPVFLAPKVEPRPLIEEPTYRRHAARLWRESNGRCFYCWKETERLWRQVDHVIPQLQLGLDAAWNLVPACKSCNSSKGSSWASNWCSRWLLIRLMRDGMPRELAIAQRDIVRARVEEIERYHFYLQDLKMTA